MWSLSTGLIGHRRRDRRSRVEDVSLQDAVQKNPLNSPGLAGEESIRVRFYAILTVLATLRLWVMPLNASLWLDETATFWSAYKGVGAAVNRSRLWPGQNLCYTLLEAIVIRVGGPSEVMLRLPSLLAAIASAWLIFRLGTRLFDKETGMLAVLVFVSSEAMMETAANARPYAIGLLLAVAATLQLLRWFEKRRLTDMLCYIVLAAAIVYFHILFATIYLVHAAYALYEARHNTDVRWQTIIIAAALIGLLILPLLWSVAERGRISTQSSWAGSPSPGALVSALMPTILGASIFAGLLVSLSFHEMNFRSYPQMPRKTAFLLVSWLIIPIIALFLISRFTGFKVFVPRYYLPALAALPLIVGWGIRGLAVPRMRLWLSACIVFGAVLSFGGFELKSSYHREDWRTMASTVRMAGVNNDTPILLRTGFIETATIRWNADIDRDSPLLCPLSKYPIPGRVIVVPRQLDQTSVRYLDGIASTILEPAQQFVLITRGDSDEVRPWFVGRLYNLGFVTTNLYQSEVLSATLFRRTRIEQ